MERFGEENAEGATAYDELMGAAADLGLSPVREGQYTLWCFGARLAESRALAERAGQIGLAPHTDSRRTAATRNG